MKAVPLIKILCLVPVIAVVWASARTDDDQDRPTLRGTNTSNPGPSFGGQVPGFGAGASFRQAGFDQPFANGFQQGVRQQQQSPFLPQQFDNSGLFQQQGALNGLGQQQQQNLLRPDLALVQQNGNLRQNSFAGSPFGSPIFNQAGSSGQFSQDFNQLGLRNPSLLQQQQLQQQQALGLNGFQGQGLQGFQGLQGLQGQFPGQLDQQSALLLLLQQQQQQQQQLQQQNSLDAQSPFVSRPQLSPGNLFESQRQLVLQQSLLNQLALQNQFQQPMAFSSDAQFGRPSRPNNQNTGSLGSSSLSSANQILLQGGQFQDPSFSSGRPFINSNRPPFQSELLGNGPFFDANNNFGSQLAGSQFDWTRNQQAEQKPFRPNNNNRPVNSFSDDRQFTSGPLPGFDRFQQDSFQAPFVPGLVDPFFHSSPSSPPKSTSGFWNDVDRNADRTFKSQAELERFKALQQLNNGQINRQPSAFPDSSVLGTRFGASQQPQGNSFADPARIPKPTANAPLNQKAPEIPDTGFSCEGRAPGHYADVSAGCRVFHVCHLDGSKSSFACGNGTLFDQAHTVCQWADEVDCAKSQLFYPQTHSSSGAPSAVPTTPEPSRTQIPSPVNPAGTTTETPQRPQQVVTQRVPGLAFGQPNIAMGSLDAGRSIKDIDRNSRPFGLFAPPQVRPPLLRSSHLD